MRVRTKYGDGLLIGINTQSGFIIYNVLLDNTYPSDIADDEKEFNDTRAVRKRIYSCFYIDVLSDCEKVIRFSDKIEAR